ncbi:DUF732 domain-containing protein [Nocardiopsis salina]|uniref:DUF732 domain-containing protein n=1 Tax=Nocardiopsis salina TaxID=245836 RepID=UPI00034544A1|nr:DUF732 domain-containing protein [Nocardiopsis salina]
MRRALLTLLAVLALTATAACGEGEDARAALPDHEREFLDSVEESLSAEGVAPRYLGANDEEKLEFGYAVCEDIDGGMAPTEVVQSIEQSGDGDTRMADVALPLVGNADAYLCGH